MKKSNFLAPRTRFLAGVVLPNLRKVGKKVIFLCTPRVAKRPQGTQNWDFLFFLETSVHFLSKSVPIVKIGLRVNFLGPVEVWPFQPRIPASPAPGKNPHFSTRFLAACAQFYNSSHFLTSGARHQIFFLNES